MKKLIILPALFGLFSCKTEVIYPLKNENIDDITGVIYRKNDTNYVIKDKDKIRLLAQKLHFKDKMKFAPSNEQLIVVKVSDDIYNILEYYRPPNSSPIEVDGMSKTEWLAYFTECSVQVYQLKEPEPFFTYAVEETGVYFYEKSNENSN